MKEKHFYLDVSSIPTIILVFVVGKKKRLFIIVVIHKTFSAKRNTLVIGT